MENKEFQPQPKRDATLEKIQADRQSFTKLNIRRATALGAAFGIAVAANAADRIIAPLDLNKEINHPNVIEQKGSMPSQSSEFMQKIVDPTTNLNMMKGPKSINEITTSPNLTEDEQLKMKAEKEAQKIKDQMILKSEVRKYKEEMGK